VELHSPSKHKCHDGTTHILLQQKVFKFISYFDVITQIW
jgi:hypothetical protein